MKKQLNVLLVEDSQNDALLIIDELERGGFETHWQRVDRAEEMIAWLKEEPWDIIIIDYIMPHFSGLAALKIIKDLGVDLPCIVVSARNEEEVVVEAMKAGAHDYVMKDKLMRLPLAVKRELYEANIRYEHRLVKEALERRSHELAAVFDLSPLPLIVVNSDRQVQKVNRAAEAFLSRSEKEIIGLRGGQAFRCLYYLDVPAGCGYGPKCEDCLVRNTVLETFKTRRPAIGKEADLTLNINGKIYPLFLRFSTAYFEGESGPRVIVALEDVTERKKAEQEIEARVRQLEIIARIGQLALSGIDIESLINQTMQEISKTLHVDYCMVYRLLPNGKELLLSAGMGLKDSVVKGIVFPAHADSYLGYTLFSEEPVIVNNFRQENRFSIPELFKNYHIISGLSVIIQGQERPYGILSVYTTDRRKFTTRDVNFLQAIANVLSEAIVRKRAEEALIHEREKLNLLYEYSPDAIVVLSTDFRILYANNKAKELAGLPDGDIIGRQCFKAVLGIKDACDGCKVEEVIRTKQAKKRLKHEITVAGKENWLEQTWYPILDQEGNVESVVEIARDVTDEKMTEKALIENKERYRKLVDTAQVGIAIIQGGKWVYVSKYTLEILGFKNERELLGKSCVELFHLDSRKGIAAQVDRILNLGAKIVSSEEKILRKDGSVMYALVSAVSITYQGKPAIQVTAMDITALKETEEMMRESEKKFRQLFEELPDAIIVSRIGGDKAGEILDLNPAAERQTGYSKEELIGMNVIHDLCIERYNKNLTANREKRLLKGKTIQITEKKRRKDGSEYWTEVMVTTMKYKGEEVALAVNRDISKQLYAEQALLESEGHARSLSRLSKRLMQAYSYSEVLHAAFDEVKCILGYQNVWLLQLSENEKEYVLLTAKGDNAQFVTKQFTCLRIDRAPLQKKIFDTQDIVVINDINLGSKKTTKKKIPTKMRTYIHIPLIHLDRHLGALGMGTFDDEGVSKPNQAQLEYLSAMASHLAVTFNRLQLEAKRKKAEMELQAERRLFIGGPVVVFKWRIGETGVAVEYVSSNVESVFGYKPDEFVSGKIKYIDIVHPDDQKRVTDELDEYSKADVPFFEQEYRIRKADGEYSWMYDFTVIIRNDENKITHYHGYVMDVTERKRAEEQVQKNLEEKEVLLKEIHHRVKNNLQVISSLLYLQTKKIKDEKVLSIFMESRNRVKSMALIHEKLYQSHNLAQINFSEYIKDLVTDLYRSYSVDPNKIKLVLNLEDMSLDINLAIPCGLIINELVANVIKHAFPGKKKGELCINLCLVDNQRILLTIKDNGIGLSKDIEEVMHGSSLGLQLVNTLVEQLQGTIEVSQEGGTSFAISFPKE